MRPSGRPTHTSNRVTRLLPGGIRERLFLLITLALLPLLLLLGWVYYQRYQIRRTTALQTELEVAQGVATTFRAYIDGVRRQNYVVGQAILAFDPYTEAKVLRVLTAATDQYPSIRNLSWVDMSGTVLVSTLPVFVGRSVSTRPYFDQILQGRPWAIGDLTPRGIVTPSPTFAIATAVRDGNSVLRGAVVAGIEPALLGKLASTLRRPSGGAYAVFDSKGVLVYRSPDPQYTWEDRVRWIETDSVLRHVLETGRPEVGIAYLSIPGRRWVSARVPITGTGWVAGAGRPAATAFAPVRRGLVLDALLAMLITALAFLLAYLIARTIAGPLRDLEHDAEAMGAGEIELRDDSLAPSEVHCLRNTVEAMASDLINRAADIQVSEARFRELADAMPQLVWTADPDGRVDYYNERCREYQGISPSKDQGYQWAPALHEDDVQPTTEAWQHSVKTGEVYQIEHRVRRADGTYRWHLSRGVPVRDEAGNITKWYGTATDIEDVKRTEDKLRQLTETLEQRVRERTAQLEATNKELEAFSYSVSHDLRAPLRTIDGFSLALLEDYEDKLDQEGKEFLHFVRDAAQRMAQLIDDILRLSRIGRAEMRLENVDLSALAESITGELRQQNPDRQVDSDIQSGLIACGDTDLLRIVLENLLGNAWKYTSKTPNACIEFAVKEQNDERVYYVRDNGAGFDMAYADRLFTPFQRLHTEAEFPGTGIGLSIVRRIVNRHGGRTWAEGVVGKGATVYFTLSTEGGCV